MAEISNNELKAKLILLNWSVSNDSDIHWMCPYRPFSIYFSGFKKVLFTVNKNVMYLKHDTALLLATSEQTIKHIESILHLYHNEASNYKGYTTNTEYNNLDEGIRDILNNQTK